MQYVNMLYFNDYSDVDIVLIPDKACEDLENTVQRYFNWLQSTNDHGCWKTASDGHKYLECDDASVFVSWINDNFKEDESKALIVKRNTRYDPKYPIAEF